MMLAYLKLNRNKSSNSTFDKTTFEMPHCVCLSWRKRWTCRIEVVLESGESVKLGTVGCSVYWQNKRSQEVSHYFFFFHFKTFSEVHLLYDLASVLPIRTSTARWLRILSPVNLYTNTWSPTILLLQCLSGRRVNCRKCGVISSISCVINHSWEIEIYIRLLV